MSDCAKVFLTKPLNLFNMNNMFTNELTMILNERYKRVPSRITTYLMKLKEDNGLTTYAIRGLGQTNGNVVVDSDNCIVSIVVDENIYHDNTNKLVNNFIGFKLVFVL